MLPPRIGSSWSSTWVRLLTGALVILLFTCVLEACDTGCVEFKKDDVTSQRDKDLNKIYFQFTKSCYQRFNSKKGKNNLGPDGQQASEWKPVKATEVCPPVSLPFQSTFYIVVSGEGKDPTEPGTAKEVTCAKECVKAGTKK